MNTQGLTAVGSNGKERVRLWEPSWWTLMTTLIFKWGKFIVPATRFPKDTLAQWCFDHVPPTALQLPHPISSLLSSIQFLFYFHVTHVHKLVCLNKIKEPQMREKLWHLVFWVEKILPYLFYHPRVSFCQMPHLRHFQRNAYSNP